MEGLLRDLVKEVAIVNIIASEVYHTNFQKVIKDINRTVVHKIKKLNAMNQSDLAETTIHINDKKIIYCYHRYKNPCLDTSTYIGTTFQRGTKIYETKKGCDIKLKRSFYHYLGK